MKIKTVDHYWHASDEAWKYKDTESDIPAELVEPVGSGARSDDWNEFCFVVVRKMPDPRRTYGDKSINFRIVVKSPYLQDVCQEIIGQVPGLSWNSQPVELDPILLISFSPQLEAHKEKLSSATRTEDEEQKLSALTTLLDWLHDNYHSTLTNIAGLVAHGEITFDLLYGILVPRTILFTRDGATGEPRCVRLLSARRDDGLEPRYTLSVEGVEAADPQKDQAKRGASNSHNHANHDDDDEDYDDEGDYDYDSADEDPEDQTSTFRAVGRAFGKSVTTMYIRVFGGTQKINRLSIYPLSYHPDPEALKATLIKRGRKWASLNGVHHVYYRGLAGRRSCDSYVRYNVNSRIMADRGNFVRLNPNYAVPKPSDNLISQLPSDRGTVWTHAKEKEAFGLSEEQLLLASPIIYGFSLADKFWLEFNVQHITPITWNPETFAGLVLPADRKTLLRSLIEAHDSDTGFDDFVRGKGQGLVINLFGPPGVGKTLSAEATSEHIRRPLYVVGSGDLGIKPSDLDSALERIFDVATCWNAIVLIDEADVFLEQRSLHDLERNAMVAVFLRHIEYYRGILFLTTNRITTFDEAFLSRIHVALHFNELTTPTKVQIWRAFIKKAGISDGDVSAEQIERLAQRDVNGRQIKNTCRTATSLARSRGQKLRYEHLEEALNAMEEFVVEFAAMRG